MSRSLRRSFSLEPPNTWVFAGIRRRTDNRHRPELRENADSMEGSEVVALAAQLGRLNSLVAGLAEEDFARSTRCSGWNVAELVAHCEGMLIRLVGENAQPVAGPAEIDRVGYYRYDPDGPREGEDPAKTFSEIIQERVIEEVAGRSPSQLKASLDGALAGALEGVRAIPADRVIKRSGHPKMTFGEFVASRNLEFGVHTMDIANAVGAPEDVSLRCAPIITGILDGLLGEPLPAGLGWDATTFILVGTGRRELSAEDRGVLGPLAPRFPLLR
jgi:uncharacterized protein (TIGR03083 family)